MHFTSKVLVGFTLQSMKRKKCLPLSEKKERKKKKTENQFWAKITGGLVKMCGKKKKDMKKE